MSQEEQQQLYDLLESSIEKETKPAGSLWSIKVEDCRITAYKTGRILIQGKDTVLAESALRRMGLSTNSEPKKASRKKQDTQLPGLEEDLPVQAYPGGDAGQSVPQAGSDETGCGDFFGPVCVSAVIVPDQETLQKLQDLGVTDSKAMSDDVIRKVAPEIMKMVPYSLQVLPASKYNAVHETHNLNAIKAMLHNNAYLILRKKGYEMPDLKVVDQFAPENTYYRYLHDADRVEDGLTFETKAESSYPAVAAASVIARYAFLESMDRLSATAGFALPKGAGRNVDKAAAEVVRKLGWVSLAAVTKNHFSNMAKTELILRQQGVKDWKQPDNLKHWK